MSCELRGAEGLAADTGQSKDVPVDAFWSVTVSNASGYSDENELGAYNFNIVSATPNDDESITIKARIPMGYFG